MEYGIVYLLTNPVMPGLVKIGMTTQEDIDKRMKELYTTGVPVPFECKFACKVKKSDCLKIEKARVKQLNFLDLFDQYKLEPITQNCMVREDIEIEYGTKRIHHQLPIDLTKNLLICNVKKDNWEQYLDGSAKIYYTGKKFPKTVALNKLYYFMPYLSGKGIRDLYYIKIARLGYRKEGQENEDKNDLRLVFEIERVGQLFDDYKKVELEIWRTFTDTTMERILEQE